MALNEAYDEYQRTKDLEPLYPLVRREVRGAVFLILHRTPNEDEVGTLTTDILMGLEKFDPKRSAFRSWVHLRAKSLYMDLLRRDRYIDPVLDDNGDAHFQRWAFDSELNGPQEEEPSEEVDSESLAELYRRIETVLNDDENELVRLKLEGREDVEVAELLQIPVGSMKRKYHEIKEKLRNAA